MITEDPNYSTHKPRPAANEPGTWAQQLAAIEVAIYLGDRRKTDARREWSDARKLVLPHANKGVSATEGDNVTRGNTYE